MRKQVKHWDHFTITYCRALWGFVHKARVEGYEFECMGWGRLLLRVTHNHSSHGCYWWRQTSLNGRYWGEFFRSSAHPQSLMPSLGDGCWAGWWCEIGGCCVSGWPRASGCLPLPSPSHLWCWLFCLPVSAAALTPPWHWHLFSFCLCAVCHCTVLIMLARATGGFARVYNV